MDKSKVCINRSINLAKQKCPDKTNLLLCQDSKLPEPPKPSFLVKPPISSVQAKKIRVCTGAELKKMCRPKLCKCPPARKHATLMDILGLGFKTALAGSLVYWSWESGLWGDSDDTEMFYTNVCHMLSEGYKREPRLSKACEMELDFRKELPEIEDKCTRPPFSNERSLYVVKDTWNHLVTFLFESAAGFPFNLVRYLKNKFGQKECTPVKKK